MKELIDKDLLKEELNTRIEVLSIPRLSYNPLMVGERSAYLSILSFLDTIETKEVDLEKELDFVKDAYYYFTSDERSSMKKVARHFFELGIKAKGE